MTTPHHHHSHDVGSPNLPTTTTTTHPPDDAQQHSHQQQQQQQQQFNHPALISPALVPLGRPDKNVNAASIRSSVAPPSSSLSLTLLEDSSTYPLLLLPLLPQKRPRPSFDVVDPSSPSPSPSLQVPNHSEECHYNNSMPTLWLSRQHPPNHHHYVYNHPTLEIRSTQILPSSSLKTPPPPLSPLLDLQSVNDVRGVTDMQWNDDTKTTASHRNQEPSEYQSQQENSYHDNDTDAADAAAARVVHAKEEEEQGDATNDDNFVLVAGGTNRNQYYHRWSTATRIVSDDDVIMMGNTQPSNSILPSHDDPTCHYHHPGTIHHGDSDNRLGDTIQYQRYDVEEKHHNNHPERWWEEIYEEKELSLSLDHHNRIRNPWTTTAVEEYDTPVSPTLRPVHPSRILQELVLHSHQQRSPQEPPGPEQPHSNESPERQEQQQQQQLRPVPVPLERPEPEQQEPQVHEQQDQPQPEQQEEAEQPYQLPPIMEHRVWIDEDEILNRRIDDDDDDENINNNTNNNILELDSFELFDML
jgi:hypothetical protein